MVYGFVRQSGGFVEITSRQGAGTSVDMFLPVADPELADAAEASPLHRSGGIAGGGECILLVEDEEDVRRIAAAFLETSGYRVIAVATAEEALTVVEQGGQDLALLFSDVMLGSGMNGIDLALAARRERPGLGILLASGYDPLRAPVKNHGGFEVLRKPYRREQLAEALRRSLQACGRG
jgi:CheY-like chemotaxis protein